MQVCTCTFIYEEPPAFYTEGSDSVITIRELKRYRSYLENVFPAS